ncbi:MAG: hypothetical protein HYZ49_16860 [Chloroflexi bacterium]|nr:hypothetical protein [Chloroflexota bacterium]
MFSSDGKRAYFSTDLTSGKISSFWLT